MSISQEQIRQISSSILVSDVLTYIEQHRSEYEEFLKEEEKAEIVINEKRKDKVIDNDEDKTAYRLIWLP